MSLITLSLSPPEVLPPASPTKPCSLEMPNPGSSQTRDTNALISTIDVFGRGAPSTIPVGSTIFSNLPLAPPVSPTDSSFSTGTRSKKTSVSRVVMTALESGRPQLFTRKKKGSKSENEEIRLVPLGGSGSVPDDLQRIGTGSSSTPSQKGGTGTLRVVGRGGIGSRPRTATGAPEPAGGFRFQPQSHTSLDIDRQTSSSKSGNSTSVPRVVGRGGTGSRPRQLAKDSEEVNASLLSKLVNPDPPPQTFRVPGRGGVGSRPRPVKPKNKSETKSNPGSSKLKFKPKWKGKSKAPSLESALPVYDIAAPTRRSTDSNSSVSTIHFAQNQSRPPSMAPTSKASSIKDGSSVPSTPGFTSVSSTVEDLPLTPLTSAGSIMSDVSDLSVDLTTPSIRAKRRLDKLAKTLGDLPPEFMYDSQRSRLDSLPPIQTDALLSNMRTTTKAQRRTSFSSFSSLILNNNRRLSVQAGSDDSNHLSFSLLPDDLSDGWGEVRFSPRTSMRSSMSSGPASPITFAPFPPTPVAEHAKRRSRSPVSVASEPPMTSPTPDGKYDEEKEEEDASEYISSLPSPTLGRSHSFSHVSRKRGERTHGHSASESQHQRRPDTPFGVELLPAKANWLNPPPEEETIVIARSSTEPQQRWEGQWNEDLQEVIRSLRTLR